MMRFSFRLLCFGCLLMILPVGWADAVEEQSSLPDALSVFLKARTMELEGDYREALQTYAEAINEAPDVDEIRIAAASLYMNLGMAEESAGLLEDREDLDWYGKRVRALSLAQASNEHPEKIPDARKALEEVLLKRSEDPNVQYALIRLLEASGDLAEAASRMGDLREGMKDNAQLALMEAGLLSSLGKNLEALESYQVCAEVEETCRQGVVQSLVALGRMGEAGEQLLKWLAPDDLDRMMQAAAMLADGGRPRRALSVIDRVLRTEPDSTEARRFKAILLQRMHRYEEAGPILKKLIRKNPQDVDLLLAGAGVKAALVPEDIKDARELLDRAWELVSRDSSSSEALNVALSAARIELDAAHPSSAGEWLARISDVGVAGGAYVYLLAESYRRAGNFASGAAALLRLEPQLEESDRPLAIVLGVDLAWRAGDKKALRRLEKLINSAPEQFASMALEEFQNLGLWEEMTQASERLLARFPESPTIQFAAASALERNGRFDEAVELFEKILTKDPENSSAANYLGYMLADAGVRLEYALTLIQRAVDADPENAAYLDSLGWVHFRLGRIDEARLELERAAEMAGQGRGDILAHLGEVLLQEGETDRGREILLKALEAGCDQAQRVQALLAGEDPQESPKP